MDSTHHTLDGSRPVHPECAAHEGGLCSCSTLWHEWDGSPEKLDRKIEVAERTEMRTRHGIHSRRGRGHGPDSDESDVIDLPSNYETEDGEETGYPDSNELEIAGFWKESERLKDCAK